MGGLGSQLDAAYQDVDGTMSRADGGARRDQSDLATVDATVLSLTDRSREDTVVLTTDPVFLALYPYWGFLASFGPYSNPLGRYPERVAEITRWADARTPADLAADLRSSPFGAPDAFVLRAAAPTDGHVVDGAGAGLPGAYYLRITENTFPNDPNLYVRWLAFDPAAMAGMAVRTVGAYVVVVPSPEQ
ncbi:arabinofuranosyltransferase [Tsukamurella soli]|uniref:arabinofuranosyltransferase n=1 Tax=Tsukamurella soli TaxID=644556 RepID=UPI00361E122F